MHTQFTEQKKVGRWSYSHICDNWYFYLFESWNIIISLPSGFLRAYSTRIMESAMGLEPRNEAVTWKRSAKHCVILKFQVPVKYKRMGNPMICQHTYFLPFFSDEWKEKQSKPRIDQRCGLGYSSAIATRIRSICVFKQVLLGIKPVAS